MTMKIPSRSLGLAAASAAAALAVPAALVAPSAATAQAQPSDLSSAVTALRAISTMRADFIQADPRGNRVKGVLTLKRPGRIRFQYEKGVPMLIVSDGSALTFIDYGVKQVQRWPIKNSPLGALLDPNRDVMQYGKLVPSSSSQVVSVEVRDRKHPEYGVITLVFTRKAGAPGGLELASWATLDSQNTRTIVTLSNQQYGVAVPDNTFRYNDPRGNGKK
ncbi:MAG: LolA family protein [Novosphingobium sp.]